ncbi:hypothetical protein [Agromyces neolithicus]|uniref:hypothetical protein n=1 Tax=Agromyces neolithicus TaxID=269420 RepID=UPI0031E1490E
MSATLDQARGLLSSPASARSHSLRAACWLARVALEDAVRDLLQRKSLEPGEGNMRSLLVCLEVAYLEDYAALVVRAEYAWSRLSDASHHHAFELGPTFGEVNGLIDAVALVEAGSR